jgi:transposase-like protein
VDMLLWEAWEETTEKKGKREKRVYDEAFRREAVALLQSSDEPWAQIATELGVSQWNLRDWRKQ